MPYTQQHPSSPVFLVNVGDNPYDAVKIGAYRTQQDALSAAKTYYTKLFFDRAGVPPHICGQATVKHDRYTVVRYDTIEERRSMDIVYSGPYFFIYQLRLNTLTRRVI